MTIWTSSTAWAQELRAGSSLWSVWQALRGGSEKGLILSRRGSVWAEWGSQGAGHPKGRRSACHLHTEPGSDCCLGRRGAICLPASKTKTPVFLCQVTVTVPSEKSSLSRETEGRKKCPHCLPDEQQPWGQQEADPVQVGVRVEGTLALGPVSKTRLHGGRRGSRVGKRPVPFAALHGHWAQLGALPC